MVTEKRLKEVLEYNPQTGLFTWKTKKYNNANTSGAGCVKNGGYVSIMVDGKNYYAHRLAWVYVFGNSPIGQIDHINSIKNDNRIENLRDVSAVINMQNKVKALSSNKSTGLLGVTYVKKNGTYTAQIRVDGKKINLGFFKTATEGYEAYLSAKRKLHDGCML
jgi:hypothetical protein